MELSERCIQTLEKEGFKSVYESSDTPGAVYGEYSHNYKVVIFVTEGSMEITMNDKTQKLLPGDRVDIPADTLHKVVAGSAGCQLVIGESE